jgi:hypothetical protein
MQQKRVLNCLKRIGKSKNGNPKCGFNKHKERNIPAAK